MNTLRPVLLFGFQLLLSLVATFAIHLITLYRLGEHVFEHQIIHAYLANFFLAFGIALAIFKLKNKLKDQIGFLFMLGSFLKFAVFFIFFYPNYKIDHNINSLEFASFFIPYAICLVLETIFIAKLLKEMDKV